MVNKFISLESLRVSSESNPHCLPHTFGLLQHLAALKKKKQAYITKGAWMLRNG